MNTTDVTSFVSPRFSQAGAPMERSSSAFGSTEEIFFGGASAADFEYMAEAAGNDAAVSAYLGDPSSITAASRRRIVRRPIGSNYQASSIIFSSATATGRRPRSALSHSPNFCSSSRPRARAVRDPPLLLHAMPLA